MRQKQKFWARRRQRKKTIRDPGQRSYNIVLKKKGTTGSLSNIHNRSAKENNNNLPQKHYKTNHKWHQQPPQNWVKVRVHHSNRTSWTETQRPKTVGACRKLKIWATKVLEQSFMDWWDQKERKTRVWRRKWSVRDLNQTSLSMKHGRGRIVWNACIMHLEQTRWSLMMI